MGDRKKKIKRKKKAPHPEGCETVFVKERSKERSTKQVPS
tara:strand:- start:1455 stop:1574 length:120 start_codon:yes stop_codon:yes gene_type:complete